MSISGASDMTEPENLVLEHHRAIRGEMTKLADWMQTMSTEITHHLFGAIATQNHDHIDIAEIKVRLDRIEKRLELVD
jgi:hypothetical protein